MTEFRFIHSSDLHLGKRFSNIPDETFRGRLQEARHGVLSRLHRAAHDHRARHVLLAGDIFDTETPSDAVWRQALGVMGTDPDIHWWLLPGNHDSLAAEALWDRVLDHAPPNVHPLLEPRAISLAPGVTLLPAPTTRRYPGRNLTDWFEGHDTDPRDIRIGLAHGGTVDFSEDGDQPAIAPDLALTARLDYLALGDWHGRVNPGPRAWYSGTPERDGFKHDGRGGCLAVTLAGGGAAPRVSPVETGVFHWSDEVLPLLPGQDAAAALYEMLPAGAATRRDSLVRVRAEGRATLQQHAALDAAARQVAPEFGHFVLNTDRLATEVEAEDLDEIDRGGALRLAAESLRNGARDPDSDAASRAVAAAALNRLYAYLKEGGK
ncbi:DNA repair exonuclease [Halovulum dunhuangense]|uniref:DNA repair exonuclease n=1 Tax=Halovulum dunhuangense TaxID=1505036 RepID=A0A849KUK6_9RHOB|nr:DNA repair exonuclease [Halovulum dunhuangense]NNU78988.1 DNA repair exonuclease [Halovulum dunhuangense]